MPDIRNDGLETEKRPTFTADEYNTLHRKLRVWVAQAREGNETLMRQKLRDYIFVLANTGIRPGTESMNLKWSSVFTYEKNGVRYLAMKVKGKTRKEREVTARHSVFRYMDRLRKLSPKWAKGSFEEFLSQQHNEYIFRVNGKDAQTAFGRMFARFLEDAGLLVDKVTGKHRTLYSLRHLYATFALTRGELSVYQLAKHMGTSVAMIEAHYGQLLLRDIADKIAGDKELLVERAEREKPAAKKKTVKTA